MKKFHLILTEGIVLSSLSAVNIGYAATMPCMLMQTIISDSVKHTSSLIWKLYCLFQVAEKMIRKHTRSNILPPCNVITNGGANEETFPAHNHVDINSITLTGRRLCPTCGRVLKCSSGVDGGGGGENSCGSDQREQNERQCGTPAPSRSSTPVNRDETEL